MFVSHLGTCELRASVNKKDYIVQVSHHTSQFAQPQRHSAVAVPCCCMGRFGALFLFFFASG